MGMLKDINMAVYSKKLKFNKNNISGTKRTLLGSRFVKSMLILLTVLATSVSMLFAVEIVGNGKLKVSLEKTESGVKLGGIMNDDHEILNTNTNGDIFLCLIDGVFLKSSEGWNNTTVTNDGENAIILLSDPKNEALNDSLTIIVKLSVRGNKSIWNISVSGLRNNSLTDLDFPCINLKSRGSDAFLVPRYSGKVVKNPFDSAIDIILNYPTGWEATMQFAAYYNDEYGLYLGTHDPDASQKKIIVKKENGGLLYCDRWIVPDKNKKGNDYKIPGTFQLELFAGGWYEASQIYRKWVSSASKYWPTLNENRNRRQDALGSIAVWAYYADQQSDDDLKNTIQKYADYMNVPIGIHWYKWNNKEFDNDYPEYFPERPGMNDLVDDLQESKRIYLMPYINGRLFDTDLSDYLDNGYPYATKKENGAIYYQDFNGNRFAVMCPTQSPWRDILVDASQQLTNRIGCSSVYLDQICAAGPCECMDSTHNHPLAGGHWWRDGYKQLLETIHGSIVDSVFITAEGACDYLADQVDGFLVEGWTTDNLVPAFQAVYSGKVQLFGTSTSTANYHNQSFYCKLTQAFVNGIQPGRTSAWIVSDPNAADKAKPFVRRLARMRFKLKDYLSFGRMLKPTTIEGDFPQITSIWYDYGAPIEVTLSALQSAFWQNKQADKTAVILANCSMNDNLSFSFNFNGSAHGLEGRLAVREITEDDDGIVTYEDNSFTKNISLAPLEIKALIIKPDSVLSVEDYSGDAIYNLLQNYPNPFNPVTKIMFEIPRRARVKLSVYDIRGRVVKVLVNRKINAGNYSFKFDGASLSSGVYFYRLECGNFVEIKKMVLLK